MHSYIEFSLYDTDIYSNKNIDSSIYLRSKLANIAFRVVVKAAYFHEDVSQRERTCKCLAVERFYSRHRVRFYLYSRFLANAMVRGSLSIRL